MKPPSSPKWLAVGVMGAFLFCLSLCAIVRSCELRAMGHVGMTVVERDAYIWRNFYASRSR